MKIKKFIVAILFVFLMFTASCNNDSSSSSPINYNCTDEPYFKYAWHFNFDNLESSFVQKYSINSSAHINIKKAWDITKGSDIKIAIIDDSFETSHEDLKDNIVATYNATNKSSNVENTSNESSHGNTCAGFVASPANGKGLVGSAPKASLILIALQDEATDSIIRAFEYAKNQGAKVISCSWGTYSINSSVSAKLKELYDAGIVILFASGNDTYNLDDSKYNDESESEYVIGIGASSEVNDVTSYSNYGKNIDILSPGGDKDTSSGILGLDDTGTKGSSDQIGLVTNNYAFTNGTSFSCPIAAGVVALILSAKSSLTPSEVRTILIETADKIGTSNGASYNSSGFDTKRAYGKINAYNAVYKAKNL